MKKRICFVLACHNRRSATLKCLESVFQQESDDSVEIEAVLLDDASTDGTATSVMEYFPKVVVLHGSGSLYWNGGMHRALGVAKERNFDYYVLLNDDTVLYSFALKALLSTHEKLVLGGHGSVVVIGSTQDSRSGQLTYGGRRSTSNWNPLKMEKIEPLDEPVMSHTMNGNCVLIPRAVVDKVGNLDGHFTHSMGDMDYGFRVRKLGGELWVAPGFVGVCDLNPGSGMWTDKRLPLFKRWTRLLGPKGLPPLEWMIFTYRHGGWLWPILWVGPYLKFWIKAMKG